MFTKQDLGLILKYKSLFVSIVLTVWIIGLTFLHSDWNNRYKVHRVKYDFYISNQNIFDTRTVLPNHLEGAMVFNAEVMRMLGYLEHPFLLDSLKHSGLINLDTLFELELAEGQSLEEAFYGSLNVVNKNNTPYINLLVSVRQHRSLAYEFTIAIVNLIVERYNNDLIKELKDQLKDLPEGSQKQRMENALIIYKNRKPINVGLKINSFYSMSQEELITRIISILIIGLTLAYILVLIRQKYQTWP